MKKKKTLQPLIYFSIVTSSESTSIKMCNGGKTHHTIKNNPQDKLICEVTNHSSLQTPTDAFCPFQPLSTAFSQAER